MKGTFLKYFFNYLIHAKTRQSLLFLAVAGLIISSFALLVLQSTMGGLQEKLMARSKGATGHYVAEFQMIDETRIQSAIEQFKKENIIAYGELELELLVKYGSYYAPMIVHGVKTDSSHPSFLKKEDMQFKELILPHALARKVNAHSGDLVRLMSPAHLVSFMGDVPRMSSVYVDYLMSTNVPEVDDFHAWAALIRIQALVRKKSVNRIRIFSSADRTEIESILNTHKLDYKLYSWEQKHATLVWALTLETSVMVFLFIAMTLLVSLAITSGLMVFFSKIKPDLASFWILGSSEKEVLKSSKFFLVAMTFLSVLIGLALGLVFLWILDSWGGSIMPSVFVDRKIPVNVTLKNLAISFFVPFSISLLFAILSLKAFKRDTDYLRYIRQLGS